MNSHELRQEIESRKPRYLAKYQTFIETISTKGSKSGGDYIKFGAYYQTYMYAFMIGYKIGQCNPIAGGGDSRDFAPIVTWKPYDLVNYILMLILSEGKDKIGFEWIELEDMSEEDCKLAIATIIRRIEGYANTGFEYLYKRFSESKNEFSDPFVYTNILRELSSK